MPTYTADVAIVGGGVVGAAILHALAHRGVDAVLLEAESDLAYQASGTNSGILHSGFDSTPGELETRLILRGAQLRPAVLDALGVPVLALGAVLVPRGDEDAATIDALAENAASNGVEVSIRPDDGALLVPSESVTDPVAFTLALGRSAERRGARILLRQRVVGIDTRGGTLTLATAQGDTVSARAVVNAAGLFADEVARLIGDDSFEIYPRKGEFFVFELPGGRTLDSILLPVPTKRTKGVLVFPSIDGRVIAGPTAHDQEDKGDWASRPEARAEVLEKAVQTFPALAGLEPVATYAGLRPAGRETNYLIAPSSVDSRFVNVAAIRSTGLSASLGIAEFVLELLRSAGIESGAVLPPTPVDALAGQGSWWRRTARHRAVDTGPGA